VSVDGPAQPVHTLSSHRVLLWPLQDIVSPQGFCSQVRHPNILPPLTCIAHPMNTATIRFYTLPLKYSLIAGFGSFLAPPTDFLLA